MFKIFDNSPKLRHSDEALIERQRCGLYQPRATPWEQRQETQSAEGALQCGLGAKLAWSLSIPFGRTARRSIPAYPVPFTLPGNSTRNSLLADRNLLDIFSSAQMREVSAADHRSLLPSRILLLVLAIAVGLEDFRIHFMVRITHSHSLDSGVIHSHPEIFGLLADDIEFPLCPHGPGPKEHSHVARSCYESPSTEVAFARLVFPPLARRHGWRDDGVLMGPVRSGDRLFRPPC